MEIQRRVVNKETGEEEGIYQLINLDGEFYWAYTNYAYFNEAPILYLGKDRNRNKDMDGMGGVLYFKEEDLGENST